MSRHTTVATVAAVAAVTIAVAACEERKPGAEDPPSRVNASKTQARQGATPEAFCDAYFPPGKGPALQWPPMAPAVGAGTLAAPPAAAAGWRWINVWATWCKPCVEEMPRLRGWRAKLAAGGKPFDLVFVSVDEADAEVAAFRARHPDAPPSMRLADPSKYLPWFHDLGLPGEPPIPVHFVVDPTGRVRCARAGGVREQDHAVIEKLLGG